MVTERSIRRTVLPSGLTILTERMEHIRSVAMGCGFVPVPATSFRR